MMRIIVKSIILSILLSLLLRSCCHAEVNSSMKCQPIKIAVLQDLTGSMDSNDIPVLKMGDVEAMIKLLNRCGGELGVGSISENSNKRLARLIIEIPPVEPLEPSKKGNPYKAARLHADYKDQLSKYKTQYAEWSQKSTANIDIFKSDVNKILSSKVAKRSDIWGALKRADLFLTEDGSSWGSDLKLYALLITDGEDNVRKKIRPDLKGKTQHIVVPGSLGVLADLNPLKFESIDAALRYINSHVSERRN